MAGIRSRKTMAMLLVVCGMACPTHGELQQVEVGGSIVVLGEYYRNVSAHGDGLRWPAHWHVGRPVGGEGGIYSGFGWDDDGPGYALISQWTRLHVNAGFTEDVRSFVEFDSVDVWGEDFRSDYVTGVDGRADSSDDIEVYQAYIEASRIYDTPLRLRVGRQELRFGSEWLVGANDSGPVPAWGLSFDAARLTWEGDALTVDAWVAKLAERSDLERDGDTDFYGFYGSYEASEQLTIDAYWLYLRDGASAHDTDMGILIEWIEDFVGVDNYGAVQLHTVGLRTAGELDAFDFEAEAAMQFGETGTLGTLFRPVLYGDNSDFHAWACNVQLGYTFDVAWTPRLYFGYAFLDGHDNREISVGDWLGALFNPFHTSHASIGFNRLFSNWYYSGILDGTDMSNAHIFQVGVESAPTEQIEVCVDLGYYRADEHFDRPVVPFLGFWTEPGSDELGWELDANITYHYSEDLYFCVGWDHLFVGEGLEDGSFTVANGLEFNGGSSDEDADYWYVETGIEF